jgi:hypothetical protein
MRRKKNRKKRKKVLAVREKESVDHCIFVLRFCGSLPTLCFVCFFVCLVVDLSSSFFHLSQKDQLELNGLSQLMEQ